MPDAPSPTVTQFYLDGDPAPTPERMVAHRCEARGLKLEDVAVAPVIVATFFPALAAFGNSTVGPSRCAPGVSNSQRKA